VPQQQTLEIITKQGLEQQLMSPWYGAKHKEPCNHRDHCMRIKGIDPEKAPASLKPVFQRSLDLFARVITPHLGLAHRPEMLLAAAKLGQAIGASHVVEGRLKTMVSVRAAQMVGCPF